MKGMYLFDFDDVVKIGEKTYIRAEADKRLKATANVKATPNPSNFQRWTPEEESKLIEWGNAVHNGTYRWNWVAKQLGRTVKSVQIRYANLTKLRSEA